MEQPSQSVLVIDPDAASRNYLSAMLQKSGYTVLLAPSGREGLISAWKDLPQAIILDPVITDMRALDIVTRLRADRRTAKVPLVVLTSHEDQQECSALLSAGCNECLVKSSQALSKLIELLPRLFSMDFTPKKLGVLIAFLSAKGGTGTSSLCANLAMCLGSKKLETRVAVMDLVLPIGSIANIVGYNDQVNLVAVAGSDSPAKPSVYFKESLPRITNWYFHLLAGSPDPESANQISFDRIDEVVIAMQESYDYVFVDLGRSLSRISLPVIQRANLIALILSTDLASVALTRTVYAYLQNQKVDPMRIYLILNRAVGLEGMTKAEAEQMLGVQIMVTMPYMGGNFTLANNRHEPISSKFPNDTLTLALNQIATELVESVQRLPVR
ncbi:MAG: response regulator [Anaerolineales bacterium]|jgi:pilus assembly protein CpaE